MKLSDYRKKTVIVIGAGILLGVGSLITSAVTNSQIFGIQAVAQGQGQGPGAGGNSAGGGPNNQGATVGGSGTSTGPGTRNRAGSGGGGFVPSAIGTESALIGGGDKSAPAEIKSSDWCADYKVSTTKMSKRVTGKNLLRLDAARQIIAPKIDIDDAKKKGFPLYNLAMYQEVFESRNPDTMLAGTYLGLATNIKVTRDVVNQINEILCIKGNDTANQRTATVAEEQRISMR